MQVVVFEAEPREQAPFQALATSPATGGRKARAKKIVCWRVSAPPRRYPWTRTAAARPMAMAPSSRFSPSRRSTA